MTVDIATLGLAVDTTGLQQGEKATNATTEAMKRAETQATSYEKTAKQSSLSVAQAMIQESRDATALERAKASLAATTLRVTKAQEAYDAALKRTSASEQAEATVRLQQARAAQSTALQNVRIAEVSGTLRALKEQEAASKAAQRAQAQSFRETSAAIREQEKMMANAAATGAIIGAGLVVLAQRAFTAAKEFVALGFEVGKYQDIAEKIGSNDPAGLASLRTAADVAGTSVESAAEAINRMTLMLSKSDDESKGIEKALQRININVADFKKLAPEEQYRVIARELDRYADSQGKVAVAQAIFGRGGAGQLVLLKELAREKERLVLLSTQEIRAADEIADAVARQNSINRQLAEFMASATLPAVEAVTSAYGEFLKQLLNFENDTKNIDTSGITEFAFSVALAFAFMADAARSSYAAVSSAAKLIGAVAATTKEFFFTSGMTAEGKDRAIENIKAIGKAWEEDVGGVMRDLGNFSFQESVERQINGIRERMRKAQQLPTTGDFSRKDRAPAADNLDDFKATDEGAKKLTSTYESLIQRVKTFTAEQKAEAAGFDKLTAGQRLQVSIKEQLSKLEGKGAAEKKASIEAALGEALASERVAIAVEKKRKAFEDAQKLTQKAIEDASNHAKKLEESAKALDEETAMVGRSAEEHARLEAQRMRNAAAMLRMEVSFERGEGLGSAYSAMLLLQADALDKNATATERKARAEAALQINARALDAAQSQRDQLVELAKAAEAEAKAYGKTTQQLDALETARLRDLAAALRMEVSFERGEGLGAQYNQMLIQQAEALERAARARDQRSAAEKKATVDGYAGASRAIDKYVQESKEKGKQAEAYTTEILSGTEQALTRLVTKGRVDAKGLIDFIISEFIRLSIIKPLLADIFGQSSGGLGAILQGLIAIFGGTASSAGGGTTGDFSRMDRGQASAAPTSGGRASTQSIQNTNIMYIDAQTNQAQMAKIASDATQQGLREFSDMLQSRGVI